MKRLTTLYSILGIILVGLIFTGCGSDSETENHNQEQHQTEQQNTENEQHNGEVHLTEQQENNLDISVEPLSQGSAASTISRPATVMYDLDQIAKIGPRIEAKVIRVLKDLGDDVNEGEAVALMSSVDLGKAKADYIRLRAKVRSEQAHYKREQSLYEQEISSQAELLEAEAHFQEARAELNATAEALRLYGLNKEAIENIEAGSDQPLSYFYLTSPMSGVIQERHISPGETVASNETPIHVADLSNLWVMIDAYEQDVPYLSKGQEVSISVRSIPGKTFQGETDWISYSLEQETRTMPVRAIVKNSDRQLRAGMFGTARISTGQERTSVMIPIDAVQSIENEDIVFVPGEEEGSYRPVQVVLGNENGGYVEIVSGLQPGSEAVVDGAFDLKSALTAQTRSASHGH